MLALLIGLFAACDEVAESEMPAVEAPAEVPVAAPVAMTEEALAAELAVTVGRLLVVGGTAAVVMIDGESVGQLPMAEPVEVEAGDHELKVLDMKTGRGQELSIHVQAGKLLEIPAEG
ncbi:MAG: hypothetical protein ACI8RZ_001124 [Myxococcota bacterium]|jgi:hypothetical protein